MNVLVDKQKLDILANAISAKSEEPVTMTLDEMVEAVDGLDTSGITPTGNIDITQAGTIDVTNYATATAVELDDMFVGFGNWFETQSGQRKWVIRPQATNSGSTGGFVIPFMTYRGDEYPFNAVPSNTTVTPTESSQTIGGAKYMMEGAVTVNAIPSNYVGSGIVRRDSEDIWLNSSTGVFQGESGYYSSPFSYPVPTKSATAITPTESSQTAVAKGYYTTGAVTVNAIPSNYVGSGITQRSSSDLTASGATVTVPSGYYSAQATKSVSNGTAGTPTATKGSVSNHSVSVTPSVTNTTGWITGSTINGTAVTVSASELVSGSDTVTQNDTYDVTNLAEIVVNVPSGGGSVTVTDEANTTGITCVITSGGSPVPPTPTGWETVIEGSLYVNSGDPYGNMWIADLGDVSISVGSVWRITFDGNSYVVTATNQGVYPSPRDGIIGNPLYMGGQDDGSNVPFCFEQNPWGAWTGGTASSITGDTSHNVKIERAVAE